MKTFVAVLAFNGMGTHVAMVKKNSKFAHLAGKLNGIGGHVELGESPIGAALREFHEETGVSILKDNMIGFEVQRFEILMPHEHHIYWYTCYLPHDHSLPAVNDAGEELHMVPRDWVKPGLDSMYCPNIGYLVPKAWTILTTPILDRPS